MVLSPVLMFLILSMPTNQDTYCLVPADDCLETVAVGTEFINSSTGWGYLKWHYLRSLCLIIRHI